MDFERRLTETGKLERKGPAVLAAGVFDNVCIYIHSFIRASLADTFRTQGRTEEHVEEGKKL